MNTTKTKLACRITVEVPPPIYRALRTEARKQHRSMAAVVRDCVADFLAFEKAKNAAGL